MSKRRKKIKCCHYCDCCVYIGEGDYVCDRYYPFIVMEDHCPNDNYGLCNDKEKWQRVQDEFEDFDDEE